MIVSMTKVALLFAIFLFCSYSLSVGSCHKYGIDLQTCEECVDNYHLHEGNCYVDIIGCQSYIDGNICQQCGNNYIMVNNLCCDHNCLAKIFKRHKSGKKSQVLSSHSEILSKVIPQISTQVIKGHMSNLVEIESHSYDEVERFVLLLQFYREGGYEKVRVVVDFVKATSQIIIVDESEVRRGANYLNFHEEELEVQSIENIKNIISKAYDYTPEFKMVKMIKFTHLDQYEVVSSDLRTQTIHYKTFYFWHGDHITLLDKEEGMPEFRPTEDVLEGDKISEEELRNPSLAAVLRMVREHPSYEDFIKYVTIRQKTRYLREYSVYGENEGQKREYYLAENLRNGKIRLIDYKVQKRSISEPKDPKDKAILEIVKNIVEEKKEEEEDENVPQTDEAQKEEAKQMLSIFTHNNPQFASEDIKIVKIWVRRGFQTFTEVSALVKVGETFYYVFALMELKTSILTFWGQEIIEKPLTNGYGAYQLPRRQKRVKPQKVATAIEQVEDKYPTAKEGVVRRTVIREFPDNRVRYYVLFRQPTETVRYVLLKDGTNDPYIKERTVLRSPLPSLNKKKKDEIKTKKEIESQVEDIQNKETNVLPVHGVISTEVEEKEKKPSVKVEKYPTKQVITEDVVSTEVIKIIKETAPEKKVEIEEVVVKDYPKTKEYDIIVEEQPITPDVSVKPILKQIVVVEDKTNKNTTIILNKEKEKQKPKKPVEQYQTVTKQELTPEVNEVLTKVQQKIIQQQFPHGDVEVDEIKMKKINRIIKIIVIFRDRKTNDKKLSTIAINEDNHDYVVEETKPVSTETIQLNNPKSSQIVVSPVEGKKVTLVNYISPEEKVLVNNMVNYIVSSNANPEENIQLQNPVDLVTVTFCDMQYVILIYIVEDKIITLSLKMNMQNSAYTEFIGRRNFPRIEGQSLEEIAKKSVEVEDEFDKEKQVETLHQYHSQLAQYQPKDIMHYQFGNFVVTPAIYQDQNNENYLNRYVVETNAKTLHSTILEECRVIDEKPVEEKKKVDEIGQKSFKTNDVKKLRTDDPTFEQVFQLVKQQYPFLTNQNIISVLKNPYSGTIQYSIEVQEPTGQKTQTFVLYDKEKNKPQILAKPTPINILPSLPEEPQFTIMPVDQLRPQIKYVVEEVEEKVHTQKYPTDPIVINKTLVQQGNNGVVKVIEVIENPVVKQTVTVTEIINPSTGVHVTEDVTTTSKVQKQPEYVGEVDITPQVTHQIIETILQGGRSPPINPIEFTTKEAIQYIKQVDPTLETAIVVKEGEETYPNKKQVDVTLETKDGEQVTIVLEKGKDKKIEIIHQEKEKPTLKVKEVLEKIEKKDLQNFVPINPYTIKISKTTEQIEKKEPPKEFQKEVKLSQPPSVINKIIIYLRAIYPIIRNSDIIRIVEDLNTKNVKRYYIYFFVTEKGQPSKVYKVHVEYNDETPETKYKVLSFGLVMENDEYKNIELQNQETGKQTHTSVAFGFETIDPNEDVIEIQNQLKPKYENLIRGEKLIEVQSLELKSGKVNYVLKYPSANFVVYFDSTLKKIILLNAISSFNHDVMTKITPEEQENNESFKAALKYATILHPLETRDYKIVNAGHLSKDGYDFFEIMFSSSNGKQYRSLTKVHESNIQIIEEESWTEVVQISLDHYRLDPNEKHFITSYQKLTPSDMSTTFFRMVDQYARNKNPMLLNAEILGAASKPQNLGFIQKIFYKLRETSELFVVEIYAESFTEKINQISVSYLDFENHFIDFKSEGEQTEKILQAIKAKVDLTVHTGDFVVKHIQGKDFLFGNLFKVSVQIDSKVMQALLYHDHTSEEVNLILWKVAPESVSCKVPVGDKCEQCSNGFYLDIETKKCYQFTPNCGEYRDDKCTCRVCEIGYQMVNGICTNDCGDLCSHPLAMTSTIMPVQQTVSVQPAVMPRQPPIMTSSHSAVMPTIMSAQPTMMSSHSVVMPTIMESQPTMMSSHSTVLPVESGVIQV